jgi:hypothetical protein
MPYWGSGAIDNDYAFDAVGAYVFIIKERLLQDADKVIEKSYPEQSIVASLQCLRLLAGQFPRCVKVHFRKKDLEKVKEAFGKWYDSVQSQLPPAYREAIRSNAEAEFQLFEAEVLTPGK